MVTVIDGDSIRVEPSAGGATREVRLAEIDAPEWRQAFGEEARDALVSLAAGRRVEVRPAPDSPDDYGRVVARVRLVGREADLNATLVTEGWAWAYTRYTRGPELAGLERAAREDGAGLWAGPEPLEPWEFRRAPPQRVRGNRRSRVFHLRGCPSFARVGERNRVAFSSTGEARAAGYRPSGDCPRAGRLPTKSSH